MAKQRTPLMRQYHQIKAKYPDTVLLFRLGDFYETFEEDAAIAARVCGLTLTKRGNGTEEDTPLAGFPHHQLDNYLPKLVRAGYRVAVCEQLEDPKLARGIVKRDVTEVVTPGVALSDKLLDAGRNNYLAAVYIDRDRAGISFCDISTGEFSAAETSIAELPEVLESIGPAELLVSRAQRDRVSEMRISSEPRVTRLEEWMFDLEYAESRLREHFGTQSLKGFGLGDMPVGTIAAGAVMHYLMETQQARLPHIRRIGRYSHGDYIALDPATKRNLEITFSANDGGRHGSLISVLDRTSTPMGGRLLKKWITHPLKSRDQIEKRLGAVECLHADAANAAELEKELRMIGDLERLFARVATLRATPRELGFIRGSLERVPRISEILGRCDSSTLTTLARSLIYPHDLVDKLRAALPDEPPAMLDGGAIRSGYSPELDELRDLRASGKGYIESLQERERERTKISSLKVGFNNVFGYYIEISNANRDRVPSDYTRKQTLANAERYITPELKEYEEKVLHAEEKIASLERELFAELQAFTSDRSEAILRNAQLLAMLDCFVGFARVALERGYSRPIVEDDTGLEIVGGRHPVVETLLPPGEHYVPNDTRLDTDQQQIAIITGPNMAGKCLTGDTLLFTERGLMRLDELIPPDAPEGEFTELGVVVRGMRSERTATHFYNGGQQRTIRLITRSGYQIEGTAEHRLWVRSSDGVERWRRMGEIEEGDVLSIDRKADLWGSERSIDLSAVESVGRCKRYSLPTDLDTDMAYLLGLLVGDGTTTYRNGFMLTSADPEIADSFKRIMLERFGYRVCHSGRYGHQVTSVQIRSFLLALGLGYHRADEKQVPASVLRAPKEIVVAFLQGLFDTDGYASKRYGNVQLATASERLASEVQLLLLNLGIIASRHTKRTTHLPSHQVSMYGAEAIAFHERVGFRLSRKSERRALASTLRMPKATFEVAYATTMAEEQNAGGNDTVIDHGMIGSEWVLASRSLLPAPRSPYFYDPVTSIEVGEANVYDLSVEVDHAYVAGGIVSHNSSYLRQTGLITLLAQIGSFVPARSARVGIVDKIFTRVGAQDNIAAGESTFLVEMHEAANILNNATRRSLILLDEVGRGTSTFDGISIAWSMTEYLHERIGARTLFATHYHELNALADRFPRIRNFKVDVREHGDQVIFLRTVTPGTADHSYGIQVAQMAGLPEEVTARAKEILEQLESASEGNPIGGIEEGLRAAADGPTARPVRSSAIPEAMPQVSLFEVSGSDPAIEALLEKLRSIDINAMTPLEAMMVLAELRRAVPPKS